MIYAIIVLALIQVYLIYKISRFRWNILQTEIKLSRRDQDLSKDYVSKIAGLKKSITALQKKKEDFPSYKYIDDSIGKLRSHVHSFDKTITATQNRVQKIDTLTAQLNGKLSGLNTEAFQKVQDENEELNKYILEMNQRLHDLREDLRKATAAKHEIRARLKHLEDKVSPEKVENSNFHNSNGAK